VVYVAPREVFAAGRVVEFVPEVAVLAVKEEVYEDG